MNVLILGGTGFIGPHVIDHLLAGGHTVTVYNRGNATAKLPEGVGHIAGDRADVATHADAFRALRPDVVLDMRAMLEADARRVVETVNGIAPRLVTISSMDVYKAFGILIGTETGSVPVPFDESGPLRENPYPYRTMTTDGPADWRYDYDKIPIERLVLNTDGIAGTILRLPMVYGDDDYQHRLLPYVQRMHDDRPAIVLGEQAARFRASRGYVGNVAAAIARAVTDDRAAGRTFNVGDEVAWTEREWVGHIREAMAWTGEIVTVPDDNLPATLRGLGENGQDLFADTRAIRRDLDFVDPYDLPTALANTIAWERKNLATEPVDYSAEDVVLAARA